ncbi:unnamed protein product [Musa textilis]
MQYATAEIQAGEGPKFYGMGASLDVFQLSGVSMNQASTSRIILSEGERCPKNYFNTVEAGWHVINGCLLVMSQTHSDGFQKTGCQNLVCQGFGMVLADDYLGLAFSIYGDHFTSNWMLYNNNEPIRYWPKEIFSNIGRLLTGADRGKCPLAD